MRGGKFISKNDREMVSLGNCRSTHRCLRWHISICKRFPMRIFIRTFLSGDATSGRTHITGRIRWRNLILVGCSVYLWTTHGPIAVSDCTPRLSLSALLSRERRDRFGHSPSTCTYSGDPFISRLYDPLKSLNSIFTFKYPKVYALYFKYN